MNKPFNPLDIPNVGVTLAIELLEQPGHPFPPPHQFQGAGIYAIYYTGPLEIYARLASQNRDRLKYPIYIGSAVREGAKKGFNASPEALPRIRNRLLDHSKSIEQASNLDCADFKCRYLVLDDAFILLAESVLIGVFDPVWNGFGFGSKVVGKFRMTGKSSKWDILHPGRSGRPASEEKAAEIENEILSKLENVGERPTADAKLGEMYDRIIKFL